MQKSIYKEFYSKLIIANTLFIIIISLIFYGFARATIYEELKDQLLKDASILYNASQNSKIEDMIFKVITANDVAVDLIILKEADFQPYFTLTENKRGKFIELYYPFSEHDSKFIKITKSTSSADIMLGKIFGNLLFISIGGLILIVLYSFTISRTLMSPIFRITKKLSRMNENFLTQIEKDELPVEFHSLADGVNNLTNRIQTYVKYQKELFIGTAHELKTPLAVMKLKNEVTLTRQREVERYIEVLKLNISSINEMNKMITSILDMGRQEGAQFEKPLEVDVIDFLKHKVMDYKLLSDDQNKKIIFNNTMHSFVTIIQPTLLNQIIQNFVQNALKFTPTEKTIEINVKEENSLLTIEVIDEGIGIDESIDLFAPFKRVGKEPGAGLGLFLAKTAADALGAYINLQNRTDGISGTKATLILKSNPHCELKRF